MANRTDFDLKTNENNLFRLFAGYYRQGIIMGKRIIQIFNEYNIFNIRNNLHEKYIMFTKNNQINKPNTKTFCECSDVP